MVEKERQDDSGASRSVECEHLGLALTPLRRNVTQQAKGVAVVDGLPDGLLRRQEMVGEVGIPVKWNSVSGDLEHGFRRSGTLVGA